MKTNLNVVGLIDVVSGVVYTALGVLVSMVVLFAPRFYGASLWRPDDGIIVYGVVLFISAVFFVMGIPSLIAGVGLLKHKRWARAWAVIAAVLALPCFPMGTAAGAYALWALAQKEMEQPLAAAA